MNVAIGWRKFVLSWGDLATNALAWWDAMVQEVNTKYQVWLAAYPLERLNMAYPDEKVYNTSLARQRMDLRSSALLMAAVPTSLKDELVASRSLTSGRILFRVLQTYRAFAVSFSQGNNVAVWVPRGAAN